MRFFKSILLSVLAAALLSACGQLPTKKENTAVATDEASPAEEVSPEQPSSSEAPLTLIPKPEANSVSVPSQARDDFSRAKQAMIKKDWKEAESILILMTSTYPKLAGVYTNLGIVYSQLGDIEKAENAYKFAIQTNPLNFDAYTNLGKTLREQGRFEEAEANYLSALDRWPHHQASLLNLGVLYDMYMGRLTEALAYYQLAQRLNAEEDRTLKGWIIDLQRRLPN